MKLALATLIGATALGFAASAAPSQPGSCFLARDMRNHTVFDSHTLLIDVGGHSVWRIGMSGACLAGAMSSDPIVTRRPPGSEQVCRPIDLDIAVSKGGFSSPCIVKSITRLTPAEVAALPRKMRP